MISTRPAAWTRTYPRPNGPWTVSDGSGRWAALEPETGKLTPVDPADDPDLPSLRTALGRGRLVAYRIGRRAVVAAPDRFLKVVRPRRVPGVLAAHRLLRESGCPFDVPEVLGHESGGRIELSIVDGCSLHLLLRTVRPPADLATITERIGSALAVLHDRRPSSTLAPRLGDPPDRWLRIVGRAEPDAVPELARTARLLPPANRGRAAVVHGDLHDKNLLVSPATVGVIDLDGVGRGRAEADVANLTVHLRLRALQSGRPPGTASAWVVGLRHGYEQVRPLDDAALAAHERHTWFRLACLYRFRAAGPTLVPELLRRARGEDG